MFGIILGAYTIKYMGVSRINWIYKKPKVNPKTVCEEPSGPIMRALSKFKPDLLMTYDWEMFGSLKRYCWIWFYIWFVLSVDSMNFFMKYVLWVGAESDLLKARVAIWAFTAVVASKEFFEYIDDVNCKRVGPFIWLSCYTILIEYGIWFKFSRGMFDAPFPWYVKAIAISYFSAVLIGAIIAFVNGQRKQVQESDNKRRINHVDPSVSIEDTSKVLAEHKKKSE